MAVSKRTLTEKMTLFLHHLFPTASEKSGPFVSDQIEMFREVCLEDLRTVLTRLSADPAMIMWLDNQENHRTEINENYGRELLELFSMGVGNYTEEDVSSTCWSPAAPGPSRSSKWKTKTWAASERPALASGNPPTNARWATTGLSRREPS